MTSDHTMMSPSGFFPTVKHGAEILIDWAKKNPLSAVLIMAILAIIGVFYGVIPLFRVNMGNLSAFVWMESTWHKKCDLEHGWACPFLILILCLRQVPAIAQSPRQPHWIGLVTIICGILFFIAAIRVKQVRVALLAWPMLMLGLVGWLHSFRAMVKLLFPIGCFCLFIFLPNVQQMTVALQSMATKAAYHISSFLGISLNMAGTEIVSVPPGKWNFSVAEACSGLRSLMALTLVSALYGHLTQKSWWKKVLLFSISIPLAILGNVLRLFTIVLVAEFMGQEAAHYWHDLAGFIFFIVVGLSGLMIVDYLINWRQHGRTVVRQVGLASSDKNETVVTSPLS
jgi:exosortase